MNFILLKGTKPGSEIVYLECKYQDWDLKLDWSFIFEVSDLDPERFRILSERYRSEKIPLFFFCEIRIRQDPVFFFFCVRSRSEIFHIFILSRSKRSVPVLLLKKNMRWRIYLLKFLKITDLFNVKLPTRRYHIC